MWVTCKEDQQLHLIVVPLTFSFTVLHLSVLPMKTTYNFKIKNYCKRKKIQRIMFKKCLQRSTFWDRPIPKCWVGVSLCVKIYIMDIYLTMIFL